LIDCAAVSETTAPRAPNPALLLLGSFAMLVLDAALLAVGVGGPHALLHHPRAAGLLVVWAAGYGALAGIRRTRRRDPQQKRPDQRFVLAALVLVPLVSPMLSAWSERAGLWPLPGGMVLRWTGVALAAAGFLLRILAMRQLGARFSPIIEVQRQHALETGGVYTLMRHPGYGGALIANLGAILAFGSAAPLVLVVVMALATSARVAREDAALEATFGDDYQRYRDRVGRWWPRMRQR
jgi:protein-S-isoprenylcysteine O-methyltransferase Ste14